jgi:hypothetical protein
MKNHFTLELIDGRTVSVNLQPLAEWLSNVYSASDQAERFLQLVLTTYQVMCNTNREIADNYLKSTLLLMQGANLAA